jgi:3-deoxy-D-manno-octulosonate 8-phosphate phosphatase (KDO 8-P phosphatase)
MKKNSNYKTRLKDIQLFVFDVDGVISDGSVLMDGAGEWVRNMHVRDGLAIKLALKQGFEVAIITAGTSKKVEERMRYLGIEYVFMGVMDKISVLKEFLKQRELELEQTLYMGDDLPDFKCLQAVGVSTCPNDAVVEIRAISDYISHFSGGRGAVRDVIEQTMKVQGKWKAVEEHFFDS